MRMRRIVATLTLLMVLVLALPLAASAAPRAGGTLSVSAAYDCSGWTQVEWPTAGVYRAPGRGLIKYKHKGDNITLPLPLAVARGSDRNLYVVVCTFSTESGYAWMRLAALDIN